MDTDTPTPTPEASRKIVALLVVYLNALQQSPGLTETEWAAADEMKNRLAQELP